MRTKVLTLGLICFFIFSYCDKIKNPYSPGVPDYVTYEVAVHVGVVATLGAEYVFNVCGGSSDDFPKVLTIPAGSVVAESPNCHAFCEMLKTETQKTFSVRWKLMSCSSGQAWASGAIYQYYMTPRTIETGIIVVPNYEQRVSPFKGWDIGEVKQLTFRIEKI